MCQGSRYARDILAQQQAYIILSVHLIVKLFVLTPCLQVLGKYDDTPVPCRIVAPAQADGSDNAYEVEWLGGPEVGIFSILPADMISRPRAPLARQVLKVHPCPRGPGHCGIRWPRLHSTCTHGVLSGGCCLPIGLVGNQLLGVSAGGYA
jgi:hypothetical protein